MNNKPKPQKAPFESHVIGQGSLLNDSRGRKNKRFGLFLLLLLPSGINSRHVAFYYQCANATIIVRQHDQGAIFVNISPYNTALEGLKSLNPHGSQLNPAPRTHTQLELPTMGMPPINPPDAD